MISKSNEGQGMFWITKQLGLVLTWTQKNKILISQQSWSDMKRQTQTMVSAPDLDINQTLRIVKLSIANSSRNKKIILYLLYKAENLSWLLVYENRLPRLDMYCGYTSNVYTISDILPISFYWRRGNNNITKNIKDYSQCWDDPNK